MMAGGGLALLVALIEGAGWRSIVNTYSSGRSCEERD